MMQLLEKKISRSSTEQNFDDFLKNFTFLGGSPGKGKFFNANIAQRDFLREKRNNSTIANSKSC